MKKPLEVLIYIVAAPLCFAATLAFKDVVIGKLILALFVSDILLSGVVFLASARIGGIFGTAVSIVALCSAYMMGFITNIPLLISLAVGLATYAMMTTFMKKDDLRVRILAPLFCKFMVAWLLALKVVLPITSAPEALLTSATYMLGAPHVVSTLLGCGAAAFFYGRLEKIPIKGIKKEEAKTGV